ncbi:MAG: CDGSH iron-sulfur domain-containing protein [Rhodospirillales bacterium]|nr:CDGSH iron-sulfur domain-containing protein [Rhodospirillales bacterium]
MDKPVIAQKAPYPVDVEAGKKYLWCSCGHSAKQPFCDTAHRTQSQLKPLVHVAEKTERVWFCGCKQTKTPPFCDGSHNSLP